MGDAQTNIYKTVFINYLHYVKEYSVEEAELLYDKNKFSIETVLDLIGSDVIINYLLRCIGDSQQPKTTKGNKKNGKRIKD